MAELPPNHVFKRTTRLELPQPPLLRYNGASTQMHPPPEGQQHANPHRPSNTPEPRATQMRPGLKSPPNAPTRSRRPATQRPPSRCAPGRKTRTVSTVNKSYTQPCDQTHRRKNVPRQNEPPPQERTHAQLPPRAAPSHYPLHPPGYERGAMAHFGTRQCVRNRSSPPSISMKWTFG